MCIDLKDLETGNIISEKSAVRTFVVQPKNKKPVILVKARNVMDQTFPDPAVILELAGKDYHLMRFYNFRYIPSEAVFTDAKGNDVTDSFTLSREDERLVIRPNGAVPNGTYQVQYDSIVDRTSPNGRVHCAGKFVVKHTPIPLKLAKTSLSLNKRLNERVQLAVTSGTKGYTLGTLGIRVTDSKNVPSDGLTAAYADGLLTLAVNDRTAYGSTYKVQLWATSNKISTVTVKIPAEKASAVTMTAKAKGQIDVIRDASQVLVTPSYKNCLDGQSLGKQVNVTWAKDGKNYTQDVTGRFDLNWADGTLQVSRMPGETLELTGKYRLEILCEGMEKPAYVNLPVKSGTAKVTAAPVRLYTKDTNHRAELTFMSSDRTLNAVARVELKDAKLKANYEVLDLGDGQFALRLRPGAKAKNGTVTVNLFFEGNNGKKPNATASVKVEIR